MNVAQRKKAQLEQMKRQGQINHVNKQIEDAISEAYKKGQYEATLDMVYMFLWTLKTKMGYGNVRLKRVYDETAKLSQMINEEYLSLEDIKQALIDENNLRIKL